MTIFSYSLGLITNVGNGTWHIYYRQKWEQKLSFENLAIHRQVLVFEKLWSVENGMISYGAGKPFLLQISAAQMTMYILSFETIPTL